MARTGARRRVFVDTPSLKAQGASQENPSNWAVSGLHSRLSLHSVRWHGLCSVLVMDTMTQPPNTNLITSIQRSPAPPVALKLGLYPQERPLSLLGHLLAESLAPQILLIENESDRPLSGLDVDSFVDSAFDAMSDLLQARTRIDRGSRASPTLSREYFC